MFKAHEYKAVEVCVCVCVWGGGKSSSGPHLVMLCSLATLTRGCLLTHATVAQLFVSTCSNTPAL